MSKHPSPLRTVLLDFKQTQHLVGIFRIAAGSQVRGVLSYRDGFVQAQVFHGVDLQDVVTFTYDAPGHAVRAPRASLVRTYKQFNPDKPQQNYSFGEHVVFNDTPSVLLDHNGKHNNMAERESSGRSNPYHAQRVRDMTLTLSEYALFHRDTVASHEAAVNTQPPAIKGKPTLMLIVPAKRF